MANHAHVGLRNSQKTSDIRAGLLVVKSHDHHRALALLQTLHTPGKLLLIELRASTAP